MTVDLGSPAMSRIARDYGCTLDELRIDVGLADPPAVRREGTCVRGPAVPL